MECPVEIAFRTEDPIRRQTPTLVGGQGAALKRCGLPSGRTYAGEFEQLLSAPPRNSAAFVEPRAGQDVNPDVVLGLLDGLPCSRNRKIASAAPATVAGPVTMPSSALPV
jgi:hypothetical protein